MNRNKLKTYAPKARREFIAAVTARAARYGIAKSKIEPVTIQGDVALIAGKASPKAVAQQRRKLEERIRLRGFEQVMEEAAYTWFNRFAAIRFMELHGYLEHGYRVLSHPEGTRATVALRSQYRPRCDFHHTSFMHRLDSTCRRLWQQFRIAKTPSQRSSVCSFEEMGAAKLMLNLTRCVSGLWVTEPCGLPRLARLLASAKAGKPDYLPCSCPDYRSGLPSAPPECTA